jgi:hypothetical protein
VGWTRDNENVGTKRVGKRQLEDEGGDGRLIYMLIFIKYVLIINFGSKTVWFTCGRRQISISETSHFN